MKPEADVISVLGKYKIYLEYYRTNRDAKTIILVNGALATTASFTQSVRNLRDHANVLLFDLPFAGQSRAHNTGMEILTKEDEVEILLHLIEYFHVSYLMSASWGGVSSLLSLARRPPVLEKAIICSFSPVINDAMQAYMLGARRFLQEGDIHGGAHLLNDTVGKYLPRLLKLHNHQYLLEMVRGNEQQIMFHIDQIFGLDANAYVNCFTCIDVPVLFVNGGLDEYTTVSEVQMLAKHIKQSQFAVVEGAGHFIDLENKRAWRALGEILREFLFGIKRPVEIIHGQQTSTLDVSLAV